MMGALEERTPQRLCILKYLYSTTQGSESKQLPDAQVIQDLGLSSDDFKSLRAYLFHEGLVQGTMRTIGLTHAGVVEVEAALTQPDKPTEHFPVNIIHIEQMSHSQIQQGAISSTQSGTFMPLDLAAVAEFVRGLEDLLPQLGLTGDDDAVARSDIATIETQLSSPRPKVEFIKESLRSIKNIAEGAAGSVAASGIVVAVTKLLGM
jgi:hypothetical protein